MKLLIVDDDERTVSFLRHGLTDEGYSVDVAETGADAVKKIAVGGYVVIILEVLLPDTDGREFCRRLRAEDNQTPILMLSTLGSTQNKVEGFRAGADDYLAKPFSLAELLVRVAALRRRSRRTSEPSARLEHAGLMLNRATAEVSRDGTEIMLTPKEFSLLAYFMVNTGKVLSKTQILDHAWGYGTDPLTNVVEVYVRRLRQKLGEDDGRPRLIHTVRGFGYRFD